MSTGTDQKKNNNASPEQPNPQNPVPQHVANPNPRANENIRVSTDEEATTGNTGEQQAGSEITDGEDG